MKITTIIPALIDSDESELLLNETIGKIPSEVNSSLVLVSQGKRPSLQIHNNINDLISKHYEYPLSKWRAIVTGLNEIKHKNGYVVLLDADDSIEKDSLVNAYNHAIISDNSCIFGKRNIISLPAADELSDNSRFFLEVFSNTLLMIVLNAERIFQNDPPDIQNGFYIVDKSTLSEVDFSFVGSYGGELALFFQLIRMNREIKNVEIKAIPRKSSHYKIAEIANEIMSLPFFRNIKKDDIETAKEIAPIIYQGYFNNRQLANYEEEIESIIQLLSQ